MDQKTGNAIAKLRPRLLRRARRYTEDVVSAEDLAQEALLRVWARLHDEKAICDIERYLFVTLRNLARRRGRPEVELDEAETPAHAPHAEECLAASQVLNVLHGMPEDQARLILEHAVEGASYTELARRHKVPLGTIMSRVARGRARLCRRLDLPRERPVAALLRGQG